MSNHGWTTFVVVSTWVVVLLALIAPLRANAQKSAFAAGYNTCSILSTNVTKCWGNGIYLNSGNGVSKGGSVGSMGSNLNPVFWGTNLQVSSIAMGSLSTGLETTVCGITYDTAAPSTSPVVKCFGSNLNGKAGRGQPTSSPTNVFGDAPSEITNVAFTKTDLGTNLAPIKVVVGPSHACAILYDSSSYPNRKAKCWGKGSTGALGNGGMLDYGTNATFMGDALPFMDVNQDIIDIAVGNEFTCVVVFVPANPTDRGEVWCTGIASSGQTGLGSTTTIFSPATLDIGSFTSRATKIVAGYEHALRLSCQKIR